MFPYTFSGFQDMPGHQFQLWTLEA